MKKVHPLEDKILIQIIDQEESSADSGIILPDTAEKEKPMIGTVKAIGDSDTIKVKVGDNVMFNKFSGTELKINKKDYLILPASDILAKIEF